MTDETPDKSFDVPTEIAEANARLPIDLSQMSMPLDMQIRAVALTLAQRHCGDTTVKEGNLYQQLKMDNKLAGPLTTEHVINVALAFEAFLWGKWSKNIAEDAIENAMDNAAKVIREKLYGDADEEDPPIQPHSGGEAP